MITSEENNKLGDLIFKDFKVRTSESRCSTPKLIDDLFRPVNPAQIQNLPACTPHQAADITAMIAHVYARHTPSKR